MRPLGHDAHLNALARATLSSLLLVLLGDLGGLPSHLRDAKQNVRDLGFRNNTLPRTRVVTGERLGDCDNGVSTS